MLDHIDLPPERDLPEQVKAVARQRLRSGMLADPGRANRAMVPLVVAAAVVALAAMAVGVTALSGVGAHVSTGSQTLDTIPYRQLPPEDMDAVYHVRHGSAPAEFANRCVAQAHREPAGRPAPEGWRVLLTARNHDDTVIVYQTSAGPVFCEVTPTEVALSAPGAPATSTARPTFITAFGTVAGTIDPHYRAAWINGGYWQSAVVSGGVFLLPDAIPVPTDGLQLGTAPTLSFSDMNSFTVARDALPAVVQPTTDAPGNLPVADQHGPAGQRMIACFHRPDATPVVSPQAWIPGAFQQLDGQDSVQLASLGSGQGELAICGHGADELVGLEIVDQDGYFNSDTLDVNSLITATSVPYDFQANPADDGLRSSEHASIVGQILRPGVASVRMTWPGGPTLSASVAKGTYALPGYDLNDPSLHGAKPTITVYDAHGAALGSFQVRD